MTEADRKLNIWEFSTEITLNPKVELFTSFRDFGVDKYTNLEAFYKVNENFWVFGMFNFVNKSNIEQQLRMKISFKNHYLKGLYKDLGVGLFYKKNNLEIFGKLNLFNTILNSRGIQIYSKYNQNEKAKYLLEV